MARAETFIPMGTGAKSQSGPVVGGFHYIIGGALGLVLIFSGPQPVAAADSSGSCSTSLPTSSSSTWLADSIAFDGDVDWFEFALASDGWALITLGRLSAPYRLELYSSCGTRIKVSDRLGTIYEEIAIALSAGTYYVRVSGGGRQYFPGGDPTFHPRSYRLKFRPISAGVVVLSHRGWPDFQLGTQIVGEVLNNTSELQTDVAITATYYDSSHHVLGTSETSTLLDILNPRARSPFKFERLLFPGYDHYTVRVSSATATTTKPVAVSAFNRDWYANPPWIYHFTGTIENDHTFTIVSPKVAVTLYSTLGQVFNAEAAFTEASTVAPGDRTTFDVAFSDHNQFQNRIVHSAQASR